MNDEGRTIRRASRVTVSRSRLRIEATAETAPWHHGPAALGRVLGSAHIRPQGPHRGCGPRGYVRSPARIYEDLCDRLTENPFIDATDVEVTVAGPK
jgi:hypothetical protein